MSVSVLALGDDNPYHDLEMVVTQLDPVFESELGITLAAFDDPQAGLGTLDEDIDVVLDYTTMWTPTAEEKDTLFSFVEEGGGYLGLHCASDLKTNRDAVDAEMKAFIGGAFTGHPEQTAFQVQLSDRTHPITTALDDFAVYDEPYRVDVTEDIHLLATMDHPDQAGMPVAWTRKHGDGAIFYCSLGHTEAALAHQSTQHLLERGLRWLC